jgi:glyoxylase-like metal-dependent hydrolase (beta-lactamase superfamily II)
MTTPLPHPDVAAFFDPATNTISYIVSDPATGAAAIIDPVLDFTANNARTSTASADRLLAAVRDRGLTLAVLLETHAHADHLSAAHYLHESTGAPIVIGSHIRDVQAVFAPMFGAADVLPDGSAFHRLLRDGEQLALGQLTLTAMHTPGHTPACMTFVIGNAAFVGDTMFMPDYGTARCDFPGGDAATLYRSIQRILELPEDTRIFVGHDYLPAGRSDYRWETSVAEQRAANIHIHDGISEADFVAMRTARDATLTAPQLILPSLQVNIRAGAMPPPDADGQQYLRLPLNRI